VDVEPVTADSPAVRASTTALPDDLYHLALPEVGWGGGVSAPPRLLPVDRPDLARAVVEAIVNDPETWEAVGKALEESMLRHLGRDLGTLYRTAIAADALAALTGEATDA
jgi:hypothetical protein